MSEAVNTFLSSFNRIEKWLRDQLGNPRNMGFSQMVRLLARRSDLAVRNREDDLLQIAQLRNAIVHEQISEDFVIAEPNPWIVERITLIESELMQPVKVLPRFQKKVTGFEQSLALTEILKIVANKRYSQFPIYKNGHFVGLITLRALGYWFAKESLKGDIRLHDKTAADLIIADGKQTNFKFVSAQTTVAEVETMFQQKKLLEAVLITKDGNPNGNLLGIIRPRDIFNIEKSEN